MTTVSICSCAGCHRRAAGVIYLDFYSIGRTAPFVSVLVNLPLCRVHQNGHIARIFTADELAMLAATIQLNYSAFKIEIERTKVSPADFNDPLFRAAAANTAAGRVLH